MDPADGQHAALIEGACRGDPEAFEGLVDAFGGRLYGYFYRLSGSVTEAEDLLQDLFVRLVGAMQRYDHYDHFEAFLFRIAANLHRDRLRRRRRSRETVGLAEEDVESPYATVTADGALAAPFPGAGLEQAERSAALQAAIDRLPDGEREVLVLRHFSELPFKQIALIMGTPVGTALARAHRGLARLREMMEEHDS